MYSRVLKINKYHDARGRFASKDTAATTFTEKEKVLYAEWDKHQESLINIYRDFPPEVRQEIEDAELRMAKSKSSEEDYTDINGNYRADRLRLHDKIVDSILSEAAIKAATPPPGTRPTFILLAGRGGSGKSEFLHTKRGPPTAEAFDSRTTIVVDTDQIKKQLIPPYEGWNAGLTHDESKHIADRVLREATLRGLNITQDATLNSGWFKDQAARMAQRGYRLEGHLMVVSPEEAARRSIVRYLGEDGVRGRLVSPKIILNNRDNETHFDTLKPVFDRWTIYDNHGDKPVRVARKGD